MLTSVIYKIGQAQAIKLGVGRALLTHNPELKPVLRKGNDACIEI